MRNWIFVLSIALLIISYSIEEEKTGSEQLLERLKEIKKKVTCLVIKMILFMV